MPIEFRYREEPKSVQLFIDWDFYRPPFCYMQLHEAWELARLDAIRLKELFKLGRLVLKRSDGGAMAIFPDAWLTREEMESILCASPYVDRGFRYYSIEKGYQTLRTSPKVIVTENSRGKRVGRKMCGTEPQVREVIL